MYLYQLLDEKSIKVSLESRTRDAVVGELVDVLCDAHAISERDAVLEGVTERENAMSTGIGNGVAVPHCKSSVVKTLTAALGISRDGIDFDAADEKPVKIFFILIAEKNNPGPHIKALAKLARLMERSSVREALLKAETPAALLASLKSVEQEA